jgi:hypothetical protein
MLIGLVFVFSIKVSRSLFFNNYAQRVACMRSSGLKSTLLSV